jgi:acylphosphatase
VGKKSFSIIIANNLPDRLLQTAPNLLIFRGMKTVHILISGRVQGVFFRESSRKLAEELHITGWIRNTPDEKVEALVTGEAGPVQRFVDWCRSGPEKARVEEIQVSGREETSFEKFEVIRRK